MPAIGLQRAHIPTKTFNYREPIAFAHSSPFLENLYSGELFRNDVLCTHCIGHIGVPG